MGHFDIFYNASFYVKIKKLMEYATFNISSKLILRNGKDNIPKNY